MKKIFIETKHPELHVQALRKIAGAYVYLESGDIYQASKFLRHGSVTTTEKYYIDIPNPNPKSEKLYLDGIFKICTQIINNYGTKSYQKSVNKLRKQRKG